MPDTSVTADAPAPDAPEDLVEVGTYRSWAEGAEHGLVVLAMSHPYWLVMADGTARLLVEPAIAGPARQQLEKFQHETLHWPPRSHSADAPPLPLDIVSPMIWATLVLVIFRLQLASPELTALGQLDTAGIFQRGEWWRVATALWLHGDAGHVIANVLSGLMAFTALLTTFGTKRGWLLNTLAAVLGNIGVAISHRADDYRSLGASTAIFAALGLLTGRAIRLAFTSDDRHRVRSIFVPLGAGLTMLALHGGGPPNVDVGAHGMGFIAGLAVGFVATRQAPPPPL